MFFPLFIDQLEHQFSPGDVMSFNNQRILHGRSPINRNGGTRHLVVCLKMKYLCWNYLYLAVVLQGCYLNIDSFSSKLHVLSDELNKKTTIKHVLNGSSYL